MSEKSRDIDPDNNKTANDIFKMRFGVPIQGTNYNTKWIVKASRERCTDITSLEEWPKLSSSVITKRNNNQKKTYAMRVSKN